MPSLEVEHVFNGSKKKVFLALKSYELYPEYLSTIHASEEIEKERQDADGAYHFEIKLIKKFFYDIDLYEKSEAELSWKLQKSNIMKKNDGYWKLSSGGKGKTKAKYGLDLEFKGFVPRAITDRVTKTSLPTLFAELQAMIDDLEQA